MLFGVVVSVGDRAKHAIRSALRWFQGWSPRAILIAGLAVFWIYSWPGFVGWDTRDHMLQARAGVYTDGHPPIMARMVRLAEVFVAGPALLLVFQSTILMVGLYMVMKVRLAPRAAAIAASLIFLFPYVSGVTGLIAKDPIMAGALLIGIALLVDDRPRRQWIAVGFVLFASLLRWNALAATFAPMILLFRFRPGIAGVRRYAIALAVWLGVTAAAYEGNELLTTQPEYLWYGSDAYEDIAGTLEYMDPLDDATLNKMLDGVPLRAHDHLDARFRAIYSPSNFYQLMRDGDYLIELPRTAAERDAITAAWKRFVFGHPAAYFSYRWENFRLLMRFDRPPSFSNVYVWLTVIAAPQTIPELEHDAAPSRIQSTLCAWQVWVSLTPLYFTFIYFGICFALLPVFRRDALGASVVLSAIGYELAWFFLAATDDIRYSQWMVICSLVAVALVVARRLAR